MRPSSRRFALRDATAEVHERLDRALGDLRDMSHYASYLRGLIRFRLPAEAGLAAVVWPSDWRPTLIADELVRDAADLRLAVVCDAVPPSPQPSLLPREPSALLGTLYVLEGATLGSRLLRRHAERLGLDREFGARHLAVMAEGGENWRDFVEHLESSPSFDLGIASRAALALFAAAFQSFASEARAAA